MIVKKLLGLAALAVSTLAVSDANATKTARFSATALISQAPACLVAVAPSAPYGAGIKNTCGADVTVTLPLPVEIRATTASINVWVVSGAAPGLTVGPRFQAYTWDGFTSGSVVGAAMGAGQSGWSISYPVGGYIDAKVTIRYNEIFTNFAYEYDF